MEPVKTTRGMQAATAGAPPMLPAYGYLSVMSFGAKGDGFTDDTGTFVFHMYDASSAQSGRMPCVKNTGTALIILRNFTAQIL